VAVGSVAVVVAAPIAVVVVVPPLRVRAAVVFTTVSVLRVSIVDLPVIHVPVVPTSPAPPLIVIAAPPPVFVKGMDGADLLNCRSGWVGDVGRLGRRAMRVDIRSCAL
jgi:hypothetical protein